MFSRKNIILLILFQFLLLFFINAQTEEIIDFTGTLEEEKIYRAEVDFDKQFKEWRTVKILKLPYHHAARIEWVNLHKFRKLKKPKADEKKQFVFQLERKKVFRVTENRWNTIYYCKILKVL